MIVSTSICTCSLDGAFGLGEMTGGGPIALGCELAAGNGTIGVSGAKVVAGDDAIDDGNPGRVIGSPRCQRQAPLLVPWEQHTSPQEVEFWST